MNLRKVYDNKPRENQGKTGQTLWPERNLWNAEPAEMVDDGGNHQLSGYGDTGGDGYAQDPDGVAGATTRKMPKKPAE